MLMPEAADGCVIVTLVALSSGDFNHSETQSRCVRFLIPFSLLKLLVVRDVILFHPWVLLPHCCRPGQA